MNFIDTQIYIWLRFIEVNPVVLIADPNPRLRPSFTKLIVERKKTMSGSKISVFIVMRSKKQIYSIKGLSLKVLIIGRVGFLLALEVNTWKKNLDWLYHIHR